MDWTRRIDAYCERTDLSLWSEPMNALTNLAFLLAALILWRRIGPARMPLARLMVANLVLVGVASGLWHTLAMAWAGAADSLSIALFILLYLYAANRAYLGMRPLSAGLGTALFLPFAAGAGWLVAQVPFLRISAEYWPVVILIAGYAAFLRRTWPVTATGLAAGAALLAVSITLRSLDGPLCAQWPAGTHTAWHLLNAVMLGWMIEVYRRHVSSPA